MINVFKDFRILVIIPAFIFCLLMAEEGLSALGPQTKKELRKRTTFGKCPSRAAGTLTLQLIRAFEKNNSLRDLKVKLVKEKLAEKHFISKYRITYDPLKRFIKFNFDCPEPLMKVQIYLKIKMTL